MKYILKVRVGSKYYPVKWPSAQICWDEAYPVRPTIFDAYRRQIVEIELHKSILRDSDYYFEEVKEIDEVQDQSLTRARTEIEPAQIRRIYDR